MKSQILDEDISGVLSSEYIPFARLKGSTVLVTGATGLIGSAFVKTLLTLGDVDVIAIVRSIEKAAAIFEGYPADRIRFVKSDITRPISIAEPIDYIVHGASQTSSKAFVDEPVETIQTAINGTVNMLELAKAKQVKGFLYLSSMEVYGTPASSEKVAEADGVILNTMEVRSSYPEGKRACEALCCAYCCEYGVPAKVIRLTQTFGPGVRYDDGRIFAEFARCIIERRNIVLKTKGQTERCYLYLTDAVSAMLTILLKGQPGEAYNAANEASYCSILQMAEQVAAMGGIGVEFQIAESAEKLGYAKTLCMNLDTQKLRTLGWMPVYGLLDMFRRMIIQMKQ